MAECYYCKAKEHCSAAAEPGSVVCTLNRIKYGGTHANDPAPRQEGRYCRYCGKPLREVGQQRFCNNPRCENRYENV